MNMEMNDNEEFGNPSKRMKRIDSEQSFDGGDVNGQDEGQNLLAEEGEEELEEVEEVEEVEDVDGEEVEGEGEEVEGEEVEEEEDEVQYNTIQYNKEGEEIEGEEEEGTMVDLPADEGKQALSLMKLMKRNLDTVLTEVKRLKEQNVAIDKKTDSAIRKLNNLEKLVKEVASKSNKTEPDSFVSVGEGLDVEGLMGLKYDDVEDVNYNDNSNDVENTIKREVDDDLEDDDPIFETPAFESTIQTVFDPIVTDIKLSYKDIQNVSRNENGNYSCDECHYETKNKSHIKTHKISVHQGVKYNCDLCNYQATKETYVNKHKLREHKHLFI